MPTRKLVPARLATVAAGTLLHRLHHVDYPGARFNPCLGPGTRFAPLEPAGACIPTFYAATTFDGAAFETVFRGRPHPFAGVPRQEIETRGASELRPLRDLSLVPLFSPELGAWGLEPAAVFSPDASSYPGCRALARRAWADNPAAVGLVWSSVRDSSARALLLFGDRLSEADFDHARLREVRSDPGLLAELREAGRRGGFSITR